MLKLLTYLCLHCSINRCSDKSPGLLLRILSLVPSWKEFCSCLPSSHHDPNEWVLLNASEPTNLKKDFWKLQQFTILLSFPMYTLNSHKTLRKVSSLAVCVISCGLRNGSAHIHIASQCMFTIQMIVQRCVTCYTEANLGCTQMAAEASILGLL